MSFIERIQTEA